MTMRLPLPLMLFVLPAAASAQIAPPSSPPKNPTPVSVTVKPSLSADYQLREARDRIHDGRKDGTLTKKQARALRREANRDDAVARRNARDGISYSEQREATMRGLALQSMIEGERSRPRDGRP
jgi:hypothetical protein